VADLVVAHVRPDRQAEKLASKSLRDGEVARTMVERGKRRLEVNRRRVSHDGLDAAGPEMAKKVVSCGGPELEEVEDVVADGTLERDREACQLTAIRAGDAHALPVPRIEPAQLRGEDRRLDGVELAVQPDRDVVVLRALPELALESQLVRELGVARHDGAAVAGRGEILARVEAEAPDRAERSDGAAAGTRAMSLSCIFYHGDSVRRRAFHQRVHRRRVSVEMHDDECARPLPESVGRRRFVDEIGLIVRIDEHRVGADESDRGDGCMERIGLGHDIVTRSDPERTERHYEGVGATVDAERIARTDIRCERALEIAKILGEAIPARHENVRDTRDEVLENAVELRCVVVPWNVDAVVTRRARSTPQRRFRCHWAPSEYRAGMDAGFASIHEVADPKWLDWARELQAIAQTGLAHGAGQYDAQRYERVRRIAAEMISCGAGVEVETVAAAFAVEVGHATPRIDVRAAVFRASELLLARERATGLWTLPGGWAEVGESAAESAAREVLEETGYVVRPTRLLALHDRRRRGYPPIPWHAYKATFACDIVSDEVAERDGEATEVAFFREDVLPELDAGRTAPELVQLCFAHLRDPDQSTQFD
jgi:ADP-ribose pyrophosphatase YjhB (NUDIX family)